MVQLQNKGKKLEHARVLTSSKFLNELEEKKLKPEKEAQKQLRKRKEGLKGRRKKGQCI